VVGWGSSLGGDMLGCVLMSSSTCITSVSMSGCCRAWGSILACFLIVRSHGGGEEYHESRMT
jgi:hypothetical protein